MKSFEQVDAILTDQVLSLSAMTMTERRALYDLCQKVPAGGTVVEVGCQMGCSSGIISSVGYDRDFHTIHVDPYTQQPRYLNAWTDMMLKLTGDWDHRFTLVCMRTGQARWELSKLLSDGVHMAFVDGDHFYDGVRIDMEVVASRIVSGGYLACHDVDHVDYPGVRKAIDEFLAFGTWEPIGLFGSLGIWRKA
jgi:Methyltransferase domain